MKLRKKRIPLHGIANDNPLSAHNYHYTSISNHSQVIHPFKQTSLSQKKISQEFDVFSSKKSSFPNKVPKKIQPNQRKTERTRRIVEQLRLQYKSKPNVRKIIKSWKFQNKGYLSVEQFQSKLNNNFGIPATYEECNEVLKQFDINGTNSVDTKGFLNMIYYEPQNMILPHQLYNPSQQQQRRQLKISNLIEKLEFYSLQKPKKRIYQMNDYEVNELVRLARKNSLNLKVPEKRKGLQKHEKQVIQYLENQLKIHPQKDENIQKQIYNQLIKDKRSFQGFETRRKCLGSSSDLHFSQTNFENFCKKSPPKLTNQLKKTLSNEQIIPNEDRGKTRFNGTPVMKKMIFGINDGQFSKSRPFQILQDEKSAQKERYEAKLNRIRDYKRNEKENIDEIQYKKQSVDQANLLKRRLEQESYNYATFIQNRWQ